MNERRFESATDNYEVLSRHKNTKVSIDFGRLSGRKEIEMEPDRVYNPVRPNSHLQ